MVLFFKDTDSNSFFVGIFPDSPDRRKLKFWSAYQFSFGPLFPFSRAVILLMDNLFVHWILMMELGSWIHQKNDRLTDCGLSIFQEDAKSFLQSWVSYFSRQLIWLHLPKKFTFAPVPAWTNLMIKCVCMWVHTYIIILNTFSESHWNSGPTKWVQFISVSANIAFSIC